MKRFDDLTEAQLIDLSTDEINHYIDLACAEAGVPLLGPMPVEPQLDPPPPHDITAYKVKWGYATICLCSSIGEAERIIHALKDCTLLEEHYVSGPSYEKTYGPEVGREFAAEALTGYTVPTGERIKALLTERAQAKKDYTTDKAEWDKASKVRAEVADSINEKIREARRNDTRRRFLRAQLDRYTTLADGDQRTAIRFLKNTYKEEVSELLPELTDPVQV